MRERAVRFLEEAGDAGALLYSNREAASHYRHAREVGADGERATVVRVGEKLGDVSLRLGRVDEAIEVWQDCLDWHRGQEDLDRVADLHRKIGAALSHKGERKAAIEHYQRGINLLKDGPPRLELVRLYEEAAWLYLHTGDNMLAIYASEKALRLAEKLGETRAASRAHGIFGRVFGRIGDTTKARENLERRWSWRAARTTARRSSPSAPTAGTWRSPRPTRRARAAPTTRRWRWRSRWACCPRRWSCTPGSPSCRRTARTGRAWSAPPRPAPTSPSARGSWASSPSPTPCAAYCAGARGGWRRPPCSSSARTSGGAGGLVRDLVPGPVRAGAGAAGLRRLHERHRHPGPRDRPLRARGAPGPVDSRHRGPRGGPGTGPPPRGRAGGREEAAQLAERMHYPIGRAAALEARGLSDEDPAAAEELLADAATAWQELDRPLEAARCRLLAGQRLVASNPERARELLETAAAETEALGVPHLAQRARALVPSA